MTPTAPTSRFRPSRMFAALLLLALGVQWWAGLEWAEAPVGDRRQKVILLASLVASGLLVAFGPSRAVLIRIVSMLRFPSMRVRRLLALVISAAALIYLLHTAITAGRFFKPVVHDEYSYMIQTRMLAAGHLWYPQHELGPAFESFHVFAEPVYASKYCPGTALLCAPAIWCGFEPWAVPLLLSGLSVGLIYLVLTNLIDGLAGLLGALALPASEVFRRTSIEVLSQGPMLFLLLVAVWAFLHWRKNKSLGWMAVMSLAIGWAAITRPVDAVSLTLPIGIVILISFRQMTRPRILRTLAVGIACVAPFLALQLIQNKGITGHLTKLPWMAYALRDDPYDTIGSPPVDPARRPQSVLPQKQFFYDSFTLPEYKKKLATPQGQRLLIGRLMPTLNVALPNMLLMALVPVGLLGLGLNGRWIIVAFLVPFLFLYNQYTFYIAHYAVPAIPVVLVLLFAGWDALCRNLPVRWSDGARGAIAIIIAAATLSVYPQLQDGWPKKFNSSGGGADEWSLPAAILRYMDAQIAQAVGGRQAVVLFRFHQDAYVHAEPVYNVTTARIDDAPIIRANDLGDVLNQKLFDYYAARGDRAIFFFDRSPEKVLSPIIYLGMASERPRVPAR